jgi:hypothetical protein
VDDIKVKHTAHASVKFTVEKEPKKKVNFLDLTTHVEQDNVDFRIYRKCSATDLMSLLMSP